MKTELIEFNNQDKEILRGILTSPEIETTKGVIFVHGFERTTATEKKFKVLADKLTKQNFKVFRFDFAGCGISDGSFKNITVKSMAKSLEKAVEVLKSQNVSEINFAGHSLGACIIGEYLQTNKEGIGKIVLLGAALNQKDILRFYYSISSNKKTNPGIKINWQNFKVYMNEEDFIKDTEKEEREIKGNIIGKKYFIENRIIDYSPYFDDYKNKTLLVHSTSDDKVPLESLNIDFTNKVILDDADHDMEKPSNREIWMPAAIEFITK